MFKLAIAISTAMIAAGCASQQVSTAHPQNPGDAGATAPAARKMEKHRVPMEPVHPTVGLPEFTLVTDDPQRDREDAVNVIRAKIGLPRAMQTKERKDFEAVLGPRFTMTAKDEFFDREGYINNRVGDPAKVKQADYRDVVLQFIGRDRALVTYSNIVEDQPGGPGAWKADMTWADVLVRENGEWKYELVHLIAFKELISPARN